MPLPHLCNAIINIGNPPTAAFPNRFIRDINTMTLYVLKMTFDSDSWTTDEAGVPFHSGEHLT
jgi:hypothetical protein